MAVTKVTELWTLIFGEKVVQWLYKLNRTSTHSDIFPLCRMAEWPEPISCHDNPARCSVIVLEETKFLLRQFCELPCCS